MARKKRIYDAFIRNTDSQEYEPLAVDLFDLPYEMFDKDCPLEIWGDVDMGRQKKGELWPDLSNVIIENDFICSGFKITKDTILPMSMEGLVCSHSIDDLGVLIGKLNQNVKAVIVRRALLNDVKNGKEPSLSNALAFVQMYPRISVLDESEKLCLKDVLSERSVAKEKNTPTNDVSKKVKKIKEIPPKTDKWLSTEELIDLCRMQSELISGQDEEVLKRYIKQVRSVKHGASLRCQECARNDGVTVACVHRDDIAKVVQALLVLIHESKQRQESKAVQKSQPLTTTMPRDVEKKSVGKVELPPVSEIKKYITKSVWKQICKATGDNKSILLGFLKEIEKINVIPSDTHGKHVMYVEDGVAKVSSLIDFKNCWRLTQSFGTLCDNRRVVWGYSDNLLLAIGCVDEHGGKGSAEYKNMIRSKEKVSLSNCGECYSVAKLIKDFYKSDHGYTEGLNDAGAHVGSDVFDAYDVADNASVNDDVVDPEDGEINDKNTCVIDKKTDVLHSLHAHWIQEWDLINKHQQEVLSAINNNSDTDKLLTQACLLKDVLLQKQKIEDVIKKLQDLSTAINEIKGLSKQR